MPGTFTFSDADRERLRALGVASVYLFGSHATGTASRRSDYDFAVLTQRGRPVPERLDPTYYALYDLLEKYCPRTLANDVIDIVFLERAPLELRSHVVRYGRILFDDAPQVRARFEERTMEAAADYAPLLRRFDQTILASL